MLASRWPRHGLGRAGRRCWSATRRIFWGMAPNPLSAASGTRPPTDGARDRRLPAGELPSLNRLGVTQGSHVSRRSARPVRAESGRGHGGEPAAALPSISAAPATSRPTASCQKQTSAPTSARWSCQAQPEGACRLRGGAFEHCPLSGVEPDPFVRLRANSNARTIDDRGGPAIVASLELPGFREIIMDVLPEPRGDPGALAAANAEIATETSGLCSKPVGTVFEHTSYE